jgi:hypothetical protein
MKEIVIACAALVLSASVVLAQNASTGATTTTGDASISPDSPNLSKDKASGASRAGLGNGVNSGVINNGTTGDTIGTGRGTSPEPAPPSPSR